MSKYLVSKIVQIIVFQALRKMDLAMKTMKKQYSQQTDGISISRSFWK